MTSKRVLCYGDSLTWGWVPINGGAPSRRYSWDQRWTGILAASLGPEYEIVEEGLSARTTSVDDPADPRLNGAAYLPSCLASHLPLDLVIIMLGTNDTKAYYRRTPLDIGMGMSALIGQVSAGTGGVGTDYAVPKVLIVAPPVLTTMPHPWFDLVFEGARAKTADLARVYSALADFAGVEFFDAGAVVTTDGDDGIHFSEQNNRDLAEALTGKVRSILG